MNKGIKKINKTKTDSRRTVENRCDLRYTAVYRYQERMPHEQSAQLNSTEIQASVILID